MTDGASLGFLHAVPAGATSVFGVLALLLYVGGYLALQIGLIRGDGWQFPAINLVAAIMMITSLLRQFNPFSMTMEVAWVVISVVGLARLYIVHKYFHFTEEEQAAARRLVPGLAKDRARKFLSHGAWSDVAPGRVLTREGEPVTHLVYLADGLCRIEIDGDPVAVLSPGVLIGEMTYHTGQPATATVVVDAPARILAFERAALEAFLQRNADVRVALEQSVAGDLRRKLADTTRTLATDRRRAGVAP